MPKVKFSKTYNNKNEFSYRVGNFEIVSEEKGSIQIFSDHDPGVNLSAKEASELAAKILNWAYPFTTEYWTGDPAFD